MVIQNAPDVDRWVADRAGFDRIDGVVATFGRIRPNTSIAAGIVVHAWTGEDVEVTVASERPGKLGREVIAHAGRFIFRELDCGRITIQTRNPAAVRLAFALGGQLEGKKRNYYGPGKDAYVLGILREDWPFPLED